MRQKRKLPAGFDQTCTSHSLDLRPRSHISGLLDKTNLMFYTQIDTKSMCVLGKAYLVVRARSCLLS